MLCPYLRCGRECCERYSGVRVGVLRWLESVDNVEPSTEWDDIEHFTLNVLSQFELSILCAHVINLTLYILFNINHNHMVRSF